MAGAASAWARTEGPATSPDGAGCFARASGATASCPRGVSTPLGNSWTTRPTAVLALALWPLEPEPVPVLGLAAAVLNTAAPWPVEGSAAAFTLGEALLAALAASSGALAPTSAARLLTPEPAALAALALPAGSLGKELALAVPGLLAPCPPPQALTVRATRQKALVQMLERMVQTVRKGQRRILSALPRRAHGLGEPPCDKVHGQRALNGFAQSR